MICSWESLLSHNIHAQLVEVTYSIAYVKYRGPIQAK